MTTMRLSFLPNHPLINALTHCANKNCDKDAEPFTTLKMCTACRSVSYCSVDCQKAHRKYHKHQCNQDLQFRKKAADSFEEMDHNRKESSDSIDCDNFDNNDDDDELFQPIPPQDECPICTLPLPMNVSMRDYSSCCGNWICHGCFIENSRVTLEREPEQILCCPFCRKSDPSSENEAVIRIKKRIEVDDSDAMCLASQWYNLGHYGLTKDPSKAFDLCLQAVELGNSGACGSAAEFYSDGVVIPKDMTKAMEYFKKSAKKGNIQARHNLGVDEFQKMNYRLASKHWLISAAAGDTESLETIAKSYKFKFVTKKEWLTALVSNRKVHKDEWSIERERAAAIA